MALLETRTESERERADYIAKAGLLLGLPEGNLKEELRKQYLQMSLEELAAMQIGGLRR